MRKQFPSRLQNVADRLEFLDAVSDEAARARTLHKEFNSWHEAYGVIAEEFDEFWDEVKKKPELRNMENMLRELTQIAAMCCRAATELIPAVEYSKKENSV